MSAPPCFSCGDGIMAALYFFKPSPESLGAWQTKNEKRKALHEVVMQKAKAAGDKHWQHRLGNIPRELDVPTRWFYKMSQSGYAPFCHVCASKYFDTADMRVFHCIGCQRPMYFHRWRHFGNYCAQRCISKTSYERNKKQPVHTVCLHCKQSFLPKRRDAKYCSGKCRVAAHRAGFDRCEDS